jgi:hypothetical protein
LRFSTQSIIDARGATLQWWKESGLRDELFR